MDTRSKKKHLLATRSGKVAVVVWCMLLATVACNRETQERSARQKFSVTKTPEGIVVASPDGSLRIAGNEKTAHIKIKSDETGEVEMHYQQESLAPGFPADIPIYKPAVVKMSQCFQGRNAIATLSTSDNMSKVAQFYRDNLSEKGFTVGEEVTLRDLILLQGTKDDSKLNISLRQHQNDTVINLALTEQKAQP